MKNLTQTSTNNIYESVMAKERQYSSGWLSGWLSFSGRASRGDYWVFGLIIALVVGLIVVALMFLQPDMFSDHVMGGHVGMQVMLSFVFLILALPITIRRFHDLEISGWWVLWFYLLGLIPIVGWISGVIQFILLGFVKGTSGDNRFGPNPRGEGRLNTVYTGPSKKIVSRSGIKSSGSGLHVPTNSSGMSNENHKDKDVVERMTALKELHEKNLISAEEYEAKRQELLAQI